MRIRNERQRKLVEAYLEELIIAGRTYRECCLPESDEDLDRGIDEAVQDFASLTAQRRAATRDDTNTERPTERTRGKKLGPWYDLWVAEDPSHTLEKWRSMKEGERSKERNRIHMLHPHLQRPARASSSTDSLPPPLAPPSHSLLLQPGDNDAVAREMNNTNSPAGGGLPPPQPPPSPPPPPPRTAPPPTHDIQGEHTAPMTAEGPQSTDSTSAGNGDFHQEDHHKATM